MSIASENETQSRGAAWDRLTAVIAAAVGCALPLSASASAPPDSVEPRAGGELTYYYQSEPRLLDPVAMVFSSNSDGPYAAAIFGKLLDVDRDTNEVVPGIVESFEASEDAETWTFSIRPGIEFSDQTPLDAAAVVFNWQRHQDPANASTSLSYAASIESMEVVDDLTFTATLTGPLSEFPNMVA